MELQRLKLGFVGITDKDLVNFTETVMRSMTGNPHFKDLAPDLKKVETSYADFQKYNLTKLQRSSQSATSKKKEKKKLIYHLVVMGFGVEHKSACDEDKLISSGYELVKEATKTKKPDPVTAVWFAKGTTATELIVEWNKSKNASDYIVRVSLDEKDWKWSVQTDGTQAVFVNMPVKVMLYVEVIAKNSKGEADAAGVGMTRL